MWKTTLGVEGLQRAGLRNVERVKQMVLGDCRLTVRMIVDELEINHDSMWKIITEDLGMRKICAKMVPKLLDDGQKEWRVEPLVEVSVTEVKESKTAEVQNQPHADRVLRRERNRPHGVLATGSDSQLACL